MNHVANEIASDRKFFDALSPVEKAAVVRSINYEVGEPAYSVLKRVVEKYARRGEIEEQADETVGEPAPAVVAAAPTSGDTCEICGWVHNQHVPPCYNAPQAKLWRLRGEITELLTGCLPSSSGLQQHRGYRLLDQIASLEPPPASKPKE